MSADNNFNLYYTFAYKITWTAEYILLTDILSELAYKRVPSTSARRKRSAGGEPSAQRTMSQRTFPNE